MKLNIMQRLMLLVLASSMLFSACGDDAALGADSTPSDTALPDAGSSTRDADILPDTGQVSDTEDNGQTPDVSPGPDATPSPDATPDADVNGPDPDAISPDANTPSAPRFDCPAGSSVAQGWNIVKVGGVERNYHVDLPANSAVPPAILFGFHGFSGPTPPRDDINGFRQHMLNMGLEPDARADFPFILVLMEDTNLQPIAGLDWDIRTDNPNVDIPVFEAIVGCLADHQSADDEQVFAFGFSAGATIANLIHAKYPDVLRAFVTESGLWANEENNLRIAHEATLGFELVDWQWPAMEPVAPGAAAILLTRGGPNDLVPGAPGRASLDEAGEFARDALVANGRVVIDCAHDGGHTLHPDVTGAVMLEFFALHAGGGPTPLLSDPLTGLPASCTVVQP